MMTEIAPASRQDWVAELTRLLVERLESQAAELKAQFDAPGAGRIRCCWLDDVLPGDLVVAAHRELPRLCDMVRRRNMKERKFVSANLDALSGPIRDLVRAFAQQPLADVVAKIMGAAVLEPDPHLYNGGITAMLPGDFMCPHLDNSHDYGRVRRREVVLLYYFSPFWNAGYGGDLELWDQLHGASGRVIEFRPNRLVIMETTSRSWHSIRPIGGPIPRASLTTYFYAPTTEKAPLRLTRFASWPGQPVRRMLFTGEFHMRSLTARLTGIRTANRHSYRPVTSARAHDPRPAGTVEGSPPNGSA
jgi:hypothetical protein